MGHTFPLSCCSSQPSSASHSPPHLHLPVRLALEILEAGLAAPVIRQVATTVTTIISAAATTFAAVIVSAHACSSVITAVDQVGAAVCASGFS